MKIASPSKSDYPELLAVWEASVRATHDFLQEEDIAFLKPLIRDQYLDAVELKCVRGDIGGDVIGDGTGDGQGRILGFMGVAENKIEMLFVLPECRGQGIGTFLCNYAIENVSVSLVDVNEQNPQARGFYEHLGFQVTGRSPVDGQGKAFPLLHMELKASLEFPL